MLAVWYCFGTLWVLAGVGVMLLVVVNVGVQGLAVENVAMLVLVVVRVLVVLPGMANGKST